MRIFQIRQGATGAILWTGEATGEPQALDAMAHAAGYRDQSHLPDAIHRSGLSVEALFGASPALAAGRAVMGGNAGRLAERGGSTIERNDAVAARNR